MNNRTVFTLFCALIFCIIASLSFAEDIEYTKQMAEKGDPDAQYALVFLYASGKGVEKNMDKAMKLLEQSAKGGNVHAQFNYCGSKKTKEERFKCVETCADNGNEICLNSLFIAYYFGDGIDKDINKAEHYWNLLNSKKNRKVVQSESMLYQVGKEYENIHDKSLNYNESINKAKEFYQKGCNDNSPECCFALGKILKSDKEDNAAKYHNMAFKFIDKIENINYKVSLLEDIIDSYRDMDNLNQFDYDQILKMYIKADALGSHRASLWLANHYKTNAENDTGKQLYNKYINHYINNLREKAKTDKGCDVQRALGFAYYHGIGVKQDYFKAKQWFETAINNRCNRTAIPYREVKDKDWNSVILLAEMYQNGLGVRQDKNKSIEMLNSIKYSTSFREVGTLYKDGKLIPRDNDKVLFYFKKAVDKDEPDSFNYKYVVSDIAEIYYDRKDYKNAKLWYERIPDDPSAQFYLGVIYSLGYAGEKDYFKANEWYEKAAKNNIAEAQYNLGVHYYNGQGCRQDLNIAKEWYGKACDNGHQEGCEAYKHLNNK